MKAFNGAHKNQQGFTLIELMIALTLGLILIAAAVRLLLSGQVGYRIQQGAGDVQDSAVFGLDLITHEIMAANLGARLVMTDNSPWTGIVMTGSNTSNGVEVGNLRGLTVGAGLVTLSDGSTTASAPAWTGLSNVIKTTGGALASDQLVIQYRVPNGGTKDCEGNTVSGPTVDANGKNQDTVLVERFFLRADTIKAGNETTDAQAIVLACNAGNYAIPAATDASPNTIKTKTAIAWNSTNYGTAGTSLMNRVDYFHVLLGTQNGSSIKYQTPAQYMTGHSDIVDKLPIVAVQIGVIVRANNTINSGQLKAADTYQVLDQAVKIDKDPDKYIRKVYTQTIFLRNGRV